MNKSTKIAIVGAGLAGLTAAYRLYQKKYDVEIYEARGRVGGRVHSVFIKNLDEEFSIGELGGQNLADSKRAYNITSLAKELKLEIIDTETTFNRAYFQKGKLYDAHKLLRARRFDSQALKVKLKKLGGICNNIKEIIDEIFSRDSILKRIMAFQLTAYEGSPIHLLSTYHNIRTLEYGLLGGIAPAHNIKGYKPKIRWLSLKNGNASLPLEIAKIMADRVHLNKVLKIVRSCDSNQIELIFADGSKYVCDKLILTIPCSLYGDITFVDDIIPKERLAKFSLVQYGTNAKVLVPIPYKALKYNSVLTNKMGAYFNSDKKLYNLYFIGSTGAHILKNLSSEFRDAVNAIKYNFKGFKIKYPNLKVAQDLQLSYYQQPVVKSWYEDPYAKGSYSNFGITINKELAQKIDYQNIKVKTIFSPINNKIFFAGEHTTILDEIGTMEAAVESGERIAKLF